MNTLEQMYRATYPVPMGIALFKYHPVPPRTRRRRETLPIKRFFFHRLISTSPGSAARGFRLQANPLPRLRGKSHRELKPYFGSLDFH
jgi:hypothetical protein